MALFTNNREDKKRLDWAILRDGGSLALYWRPEYLAEDMQWLANHNYDIYEFDCAGWTSEDEMYGDIGRKLHFPEWWGPNCGHNMDGLDDLLPDLPIREDGGAALVLNKFNVYAAGSGSAMMHSGRTEAEVLLDVIAGASRYFLLLGRRLVTLVQTDDPQIRLGKFGGISPNWNHREWLIKNRTPGSRNSSTNSMPSSKS